MPDLKVAPDYNEEDRDEVVAEVVIGADRNAGNTLRLLDYLQGEYEVDLALATDHQRVYTIAPEGRR